MKIVFFMRFYSYIAHYEETLRALAAKGHAVHFAFDNRHNKPFDPRRMDALFSSIPNISYDFFSDTRSGPWAAFADLVRRLIDFLRYCHPDYAQAPKLRKRFEKKVPGALQSLFRGFLLRVASLESWIRWLKKVESGIPLHRAAVEYLGKHRPDLVLFTPLMDSNTGFIDYAKAARAAGVKTAICVASWDNLTNKGLIQIQPDAVLVWNEFQRKEAVRYHSVPAERVLVTGAQTFDKWFERKPRCSREEFLSKAGLADCEGFLVYACSSRFIAGDEVEFIRSWIREVRRRSTLDRFGILVRPHPANIQQWEGVHLDEWPRVAVYPRWQGIPYPFTEEDKTDYFHTLHHGAGVVGINTSAMIEAGIQLKPVFTILAKQYEDVQAGTLHFSYLRDGGLSFVGRDLHEHVNQLEETLLRDKNVAERIRKFIREFVRPQGLDSPSTARVVEAIEEVFRLPAATFSPAPGPLFRWMLRPLAVLTGVSFNFYLLQKNAGRFLHKLWKRAQNFAKRAADFVRVKIFRGRSGV